MAWSRIWVGGRFAPMRKRHAPTRNNPGYRQLLVRVGASLRALREGRGFTQEHASELMGMGARHLQKVKSGEINVTLETLHRFATAYDTDVQGILGHAAAPRQQADIEPTN